MLSYFEVPENLEEISPHVATLWKRYLEGDDTYRNDRLKMIARCPTISLFSSYQESFITRTLGDSQAHW